MYSEKGEREIKGVYFGGISGPLMIFDDDKWRPMIIIS
jgi:hypothetical protein